MFTHTVRNKKDSLLFAKHRRYKSVIFQPIVKAYILLPLDGADRTRNIIISDYKKFGTLIAKEMKDKPWTLHEHTLKNWYNPPSHT